MAEKRILSVTQLNMYVKSLLESSVYLNEITLSAEISNFVNHYKTGHFYMTLKDDGALIKGVMFRQSASKLSFVPQNGMKVLCQGRVSLYERDGSYQFYITSMKPAGEGELSVLYEQLKQRLEKQGLFAAEHKRKIPSRPSKIAVITSPTGAAVQDILNILRRRYPVATVVMCPVAVQGELAAPQLCDAVRRVNSAKCADVIIIGRGGGSIEDLWAFNDEQLAHEIYNSAIPVISAVGHETDFTICDYVADLRAPTPSASAELAVPDRTELNAALSSRVLSLKKLLINLYQNSRLRLEALMNKSCMSNPLFTVMQRSQGLESLYVRMNHSYSDIISVSKQNFTATATKLSSLSPLNVLLRGYSVVYKDGQAVGSIDKINNGDCIKIRMNDGSADAVVTKTGV